MGNNVFTKDPDAVLDYTVNWASWLESGDTISDSDWTVESGITEDSATKTTTTATIWLSGGTAGTQYTITNHITTAAGREDDRSIFVMVEAR